MTSREPQTEADRARDVLMRLDNSTDRVALLNAEFASVRLATLGEAEAVAKDPALEEPTLIGRTIAKRIRALAQGEGK